MSGYETVVITTDVIRGVGDPWHPRVKAKRLPRKVKKRVRSWFWRRSWGHVSSAIASTNELIVRYLLDGTT